MQICCFKDSFRRRARQWRVIGFMMCDFVVLDVRTKEGRGPPNCPAVPGSNVHCIVIKVYPIDCYRTNAI
jgi:hypothetical protein